MLKNVNISASILEELGFIKVNIEGEKRTILKKGSTTAEVLANGSVKIGDKVTDFKKVKRYKIEGL
jgi:hypothetical protein